MPALNMTASIPHLFRSYHVRKQQTFNCKIWEAARATSATPTFFEYIVIGEPGQPYVDGGVGRNNPIAQVLEEAELVFPGQQVACIVSIGTGQSQAIAIPERGWLQVFSFIKALRGIATDCERSAQEAAQRFRGNPNIYFRFNVEQGMQSVRPAQWKRLDEVMAHTDQYMRLVEVDEKLEVAVDALSMTAVVGMLHLLYQCQKSEFSDSIG